MDLGLKGKTVIITGGNKGIGRGITLVFASEGSNVVIAARDEETGQKVAELAKKQGGDALYVKTDVTKLDQVKAMVQKTLDRFKKIDILVNNAGYMAGLDKLFLETGPEYWKETIDGNYMGMLNCCSVVLPHMIERNAGAIVNISSDAGRMGEFRETVYAGCKAAQIAAGKTIAREVGRYGIRVNAICPGFTPTPVEEGGRPRSPEQIEKWVKAYPLRRLGKPQDIANAVAFLASDAASWITGQTLSVSGGYTMM